MIFCVCVFDCASVEHTSFTFVYNLFLFPFFVDKKLTSIPFVKTVLSTTVLFFGCIELYEFWHHYVHAETESRKPLASSLWWGGHQPPVCRQEAHEPPELEETCKSHAVHLGRQGMPHLWCGGLLHAAMLRHLWQQAKATNRDQEKGVSTRCYPWPRCLSTDHGARDWCIFCNGHRDSSRPNVWI